MADDSKIQVIDFLKDVESNRRSLIANAQSKGKIIDNGASLTEAVAVNNTIEPSASPEKIEVRFFDADGTLLQTNYVEYGGSVIPPENPNYDPERLTFKRWASAIGERFDNITHDVDYGALYTINNGGFHIFCTFNDSTGYTVTLSPYQNKAHTITIDWGDGTENDTKTNTGSTNISHTYAQAGDYEIIVTRDVDIFEYSSDYWYLGNYLFIGVNKAYMKCVYNNNFNNDQIVNFVITENIYNSSTIYLESVENIVLTNTLLGNTIILGANNNITIIDLSIDVLCTFSPVMPSKIIIPENSGINSINNAYGLKKLISLSNVIPTSFSNAYSVESIQLLFNNIDTVWSITNAASLKEYILPVSISKFNGYLSLHSKLELVTIPENALISNNIFSNMFNLHSITLPQGFNQSFSIYSYNFNTSSFIDMLNKVQDNTSSTSQIIDIYQEALLSSMFKIYVVLNNGIWQLAAINTPNAMTLIEAFNEKNWTIA